MQYIVPVKKAVQQIAVKYYIFVQFTTYNTKSVDKIEQQKIETRRVQNLRASYLLGDVGPPNRTPQHSHQIQLKQVFRQKHGSKSSRRFRKIWQTDQTTGQPTDGPVATDGQTGSQGIFASNNLFPPANDAIV